MLHNFRIPFVKKISYYFMLRYIYLIKDMKPNFKLDYISVKD